MSIVNLDLPSNIELAYLRGPFREWWEALVRQRLPSEPETLRFAVGFGTARDPDSALTSALLALERDPQLHRTIDFQCIGERNKTQRTEKVSG